MNTNETHNDIRIQSRINIYGPVFLLVGSACTIIALFVFGVFAVTHWSSLVSMSGLIVIGVAIFMGLLAFTLVAKLLIQHVLSPVVHIRGEVNRHKVLHTADSYAIVLDHGEPRLIQVSQDKYTYNIKQVDTPPQTEVKLLDGPKPTIPDFVRYDDIRGGIPQGHALVGVSEHGLETKESEVRALIWIVGGSGVGKTNTVCIRIDDDYKAGHCFLGVDPHAFKEDSLTNALKPTPYMTRFLLPIAQDIKAINTVLQAFLTEFDRRKNSPPTAPFRPITLVVDEVGSMVLDVDKDNPLEVEVARKLKEIARICGQESRGFKMYGIYISQDAAGLSWLRKRALMVLGHQVLMMSERLLVCNQNRETANEMETWPIGRTVVYGIAFPKGQIVVQQPIFTPARIVDADRTYIPPMEDLRKNTSSNLNNGRNREEAREASGRITEEQSTGNEQSTKKMLRDIGKRIRSGETRADILRSYNATAGRANQEIGAVIDMVVEEME